LFCNFVSCFCYVFLFCFMFLLNVLGVFVHLVSDPSIEKKEQFFPWKGYVSNSATRTR